MVAASPSAFQWGGVGVSKQVLSFVRLHIIRQQSIDGKVILEPIPSRTVRLATTFKGKTCKELVRQIFNPASLQKWLKVSGFEPGLGLRSWGVIPPTLPEAQKHGSRISLCPKVRQLYIFNGEDALLMDTVWRVPHAGKGATQQALGRHQSGFVRWLEALFRLGS